MFEVLGIKLIDSIKDNKMGKKLNNSILYVEDEEIIRDSIKAFLSRKFERVYSAENGEEGLEIFKEKKIDIVLTDVKMPKMSGLDMAKEIKEITPEVPIVLATAHTDYEIMLEAIDIGVEKYVPKPIDLTNLNSILTKLANYINLQSDFNEQSQILTQYKMAIDASAIVSKTDRKGIITYVNDKFCEISKYNRDELIGHPHNIVRHPDTKSSTFKDFWENILNKKIWRGIIKNRSKDGNDYYVDTTVVPILNKKGDIQEFIAVRYDVTKVEIEKRQKEKSIIQSKTKLFEASKQKESALKLKIDHLNSELISKAREVKLLNMRVKVLDAQNRKLREMNIELKKELESLKK